MTYKIVYLDNLNVQRERDATPEETAEIDARKAAAPAARKASGWEAIKTARDRCKNGGVQVGGFWFHTDNDSRIQQMGLVMLGVNIPAGLQWKTMAKNPDGSAIYVAMTRDLANQVFLAVAALDQAAFAKAEEHRIAMEAAPDPSAYNWASGWPVVYTGA